VAAKAYSTAFADVAAKAYSAFADVAAKAYSLLLTWQQNPYSAIIVLILEYQYSLEQYQ